MEEFFGFYDLGANVNILVSITNGVGTPVDPGVNPTYRVYSDGVLVPNATGALSKCDTSNITGATFATPILITTATPHGLQSGNRVTVANVGGNTNANGDWTITKVSDTTFTLNGAAGNADYTSGGTVHVSGLYKMALALTSSAGYGAGRTYTAIINWIDSVPRVKTGLFNVT